ncbi:helix-turn-helix domain-containing protein [Christiangramia forsetii]|uniref:Protein containing DUF467 n=2 Tax=Christiangramia forsetii TaxID=411153 RepID=A0LZQ3_CHRFK|nr:ATP-binding protein [Christiangramia forsetii]GGG46672.1 hypothetical protein GCM10011532_33240 [Christiangramia forsetii]CAL65848.1 protein containing DUF467 [Christiangramia forsetii KT0803]
MTLDKYFNSIDLKEIDRFIEEGQEENLNLEFKTVNFPNYNEQNKEFDKKNLSEVISGFANSNGGIIIWGIKAKNNSKNQDVAQSKKPIEQLTKFLNTLNRLEGQAITPYISGLVHEKIETTNDIGFIKTYVPASENAPHMANFSGKHYYKRSGDSFYQCEHYDIADMFTRKKSPRLRIHIRKLPRGSSNATGKRFIKFCFAISIHNDGQSIAKFPFLGLNIEGAHPERYGIDGNNNHGLTKQIKTPIYDHNYIGGSDKVIYPQTMIDIDHFFVNVLEGIEVPDIEIQYLISAENMNNIQQEIVLDNEFFQFQHQKK